MLWICFSMNANIKAGRPKLSHSQPQRECTGWARLYTRRSRKQNGSSLAVTGSRAREEARYPWIHKPRTYVRTSFVIRAVRFELSVCLEARASTGVTPFEFNPYPIAIYLSIYTYTFISLSSSFGNHDLMFLI